MEGSLITKILNFTWAKTNEKRKEKEMRRRQRSVWLVIKAESAEHCRLADQVRTG